LDKIVCIMNGLVTIPKNIEQPDKYV